jgi:hypothetical protein
MNSDNITDLNNIPTLCIKKIYIYFFLMVAEHWVNSM